MQINEVAYKWAGQLARRTATRRIILHHAAAVTCTPQQVHQWHLANGWTGIGYHFFVRKEGTVYRGRPEDTVGAHGVLRTAAVDRAFLADEKVITDPRPPVGQVPLVDLLRRTCHRRGVVQDNAAGGRPSGQLTRPLIGNFIDLHFCLPPLPLFQRWPSDASTACVKSPAPGRPAPPRFPGWRSIR